MLMMLKRLQIRSVFSTLTLNPRFRRITIILRYYAAHRDGSKSSSAPSLSQSLDHSGLPGKKLLTDSFTAESSSPQYVGPFNLGVAPSLQLGSNVKAKKWNELSTSGKVLRATKQTTNFTVIFFGAGLTAILVYAISTELFSSNSPTVLYGEACERIKSSPEIARYLRAPLSFNNTPASSTRPRHRNHNVSSQIAVDSAGREHLLLSFYVRGSSSTTKADGDTNNESYISQVTDRITNLTWSDVETWSKESAFRFKRFFLYLTGQPSFHAPRVLSEVQNSTESQKKKNESWWSIAGVFSGIRNSVGGRRRADSVMSQDDYWQEGEVHTDSVKDDKGYFVWRYILVDIPNLRTGQPTRVFVQRTQDVREGEAVMRWYR